LLTTFYFLFISGPIYFRYGFCAASDLASDYYAAFSYSSYSLAASSSAASYSAAASSAASS